MGKYIELIVELLRSIQSRTDLTFLISTKDKHTAMISIKDGEISYLRYASLAGIDALAPLQSMEIETFSERHHSLEHSGKKIALPATQIILQNLCIHLPQSLEDYQASLKPLDTQPISPAIARNIKGRNMSSSGSQLPNHNLHSPTEVSKRAVPVEPQSTQISASMIEIVRTALQQSLGPIADLIYEDAISNIQQLKSRHDLAQLINLLVEEIDEVEYQQQFLSAIKGPLAGIVSVQV